MTVVIRTISDGHHCEYAMEIIRQAWGNLPDIANVPAHVLLAISLQGGVVLGAYAEDGPPELDGMVGVALGWLAARRERGASVDAPPRLKLHSHILGVLPQWRRQQIGLKLKLAEREAVLEQGLTDLMTWTYDPLLYRNASLNIHRLGATCNTYHRDLLHEYVDRFWVDWSLCSPSILQSADSPRPVQEWNIAELNRLPMNRDGQFEKPVDSQLKLDGRPLAVPLPADIAPIRQADAALALDWLFYQRAIFEPAFEGGYTIVDCVELPPYGNHYILVAQA